MDWLKAKISSASSRPGVAPPPRASHSDAPLVLPPPPDAFTPLSSLLPPSCLSCDDPCSVHPHYPKLKIETTVPLQGVMKPYSRQVLICTGQWDWPDHIEDEDRSLAAALFRVMRKSKLPPPSSSPSSTDHAFPSSGVTILQNISRDSTLSKPGSYDVILYPDNIIVSNVHPRQAERFYNTFLATPWVPPSPTFVQSNVDSLITTTVKSTSAAPTPSPSPSSSSSSPSPPDEGPFSVHPNPLESLILICSHKRRDRRCGVVAPILTKEFERELDRHDLYPPAVEVCGVSHVGGHKFAANVIVYTRQGRKGIWYGRVEPCHAAAIVEAGIVGDTLVKDLYKGGMDYSFGATRDGLEW